MRTLVKKYLNALPVPGDTGRQVRLLPMVRLQLAHGVLECSETRAPWCTRRATSSVQAQDSLAKSKNAEEATTHESDASMRVAFAAVLRPVGELVAASIVFVWKIRVSSPLASTMVRPVPCGTYDLLISKLKRRVSAIHDKQEAGSQRYRPDVGPKSAGVRMQAYRCTRSGLHASESRLRVAERPFSRLRSLRAHELCRFAL